MNTRKTLAILVIILALIILAVVIYLLFFYNFGEDIRIFQGQREVLPQGEEKQAEERQIVKRVVEKEEEVAEPPKEEDITRFNLQKTASSFAERFGSYSNHSNYENITDLKVFMSKKMIVWADRFVKEAREKSDYTDIYQGVVTKAVSSEVKHVNESGGEAEVLVKTQRIESSGTMSNFSTEYEDVLIAFVKENGAWKVDSAYWQ